jgi:hypothetical protein
MENHINFIKLSIILKFIANFEFLGLIAFNFQF